MVRDAIFFQKRLEVATLTDVMDLMPGGALCTGEIDGGMYVPVGK